MKSKISFFNKTLFLKNVTLYWPIWGIYTFLLSCGLPITLWFNLNSGLEYTKLTEARMLRYIYYATQPGYYTMVIAIAAVIMGMALYSYLYNSKSANMIHALPVNRTQLFGTNVISGLSFLIVPQIVTFIVTVLMCLNAGLTKVEYLAIWLLVSIATAIIAFAIVTFCAFFTGQLVALPIYVVIVNFLAMAFNTMIELVVAIFGYGVDFGNVASQRLVMWFSPLVCYMEEVTTDLVYSDESFASEDKIIGIQQNGIHCILIYLLVAIVLYAIAYMVYRKRHIEHAGDLITVGIVKPIFRWGVGTLAAYYSAVLIYSLFYEVGVQFSIVTFVLLLVCLGVLFYFAADMFVRKSFRVFKRENWKGCGIFSVVLLLSFGALYMYSEVEEQRIPEVEDIEYAYLHMGYNSAYMGEDAQAVVDIHEKILEDVKYYEQLVWEDAYWSAYAGYEWIEISYVLKDGNYYSRNYQIPVKGDSAEIIQDIIKLETKTETFLNSNICLGYDKVDKFYSGSLDIEVYSNWVNNTPVASEYRSFALNQEEQEVLYEATLRICDNGLIHRVFAKQQ